MTAEHSFYCVKIVKVKFLLLAEATDCCIQAIRSHPNPLQIYEKRLQEEGIVSAEEMKSITDMVQSTLSSEFDSAKVLCPLQNLTDCARILELMSRNSLCEVHAAVLKDFR